MTPREMDFVSQRIIAGALARCATETDEELLAKVKDAMPDAPEEKTRAWSALYRQLRKKIEDAIPLIRRDSKGFSADLDQFRRERFESEVLAANPNLDRDAFRQLFDSTYYHAFLR